MAQSPQHAPQMPPQQQIPHQQPTPQQQPMAQQQPMVQQQQVPQQQQQMSPQQQQQQIPTQQHQQMRPQQQQQIPTQQQQIPTQQQQMRPQQQQMPQQMPAQPFPPEHSPSPAPIPSGFTMPPQMPAQTLRAEQSPSPAPNQPGFALPPQMPAQTLPPEHSPSPGPHQPGFAMPPNKRPRLSPGPPSQPASPYPPSPYATSPGAGAATPTSAMSPAYPNISATGPPTYTTPYTNGATTPSLHLPESQPAFTPASSTPIAPAGSQLHYTPATLAPIPGPLTPGTLTPVPAPPTPGTMGPPSKPAEKPAKEYEYDATDSLAGTGIDIRAEEQALTDYYAGLFGHDSRTGLPANAPGSRSSFHGAGAANQAGQATGALTQEELAAQAAERAWSEAAHRLAVMRSNEIRDPFLTMALLHRKAEKVSRENGLSLNMEIKNHAQTAGKMRGPHDFPEPKVTVTTKTGPDGALVATTGSWIPHDAYLIDQLTLLSLATRHRIREKLEDGVKVAVTRQKTSHGEVPTEWVDAAAPLSITDVGVTQGESSRAGQERAVSPRVNPLKRNLDGSPAQVLSTNHLTSAVRDVGKGDRSIEEVRLRKRQKRLNPETATSTSRAGSAAPGTPGSSAPELETKAPPKKEPKKAAAARLAEASSTATANQTLQHLMGGFGGRKKKGKQYAWMNAGASGASTPTRAGNQDVPGTPLGTPGPKAPEKTSLTQDGLNRLGNWREDGDKGKGIQLRDWVTALELDAIDAKAIQDAYMKLDSFVR